MNQSAMRRCTLSFITIHQFSLPASVIAIELTPRSWALSDHEGPALLYITSSSPAYPLSSSTTYVLQVLWRPNKIQEVGTILVQRLWCQ
jgi:hypothetical protein